MLYVVWLLFDLWALTLIKCISQADEKPKEPPYIMEDMAHMAKFVYDLYGRRVEEIMAQQGVS